MASPENFFKDKRYEHPFNEIHDLYIGCKAQLEARILVGLAKHTVKFLNKNGIYSDIEVFGIGNEFDSENNFIQTIDVDIWNIDNKIMKVVNPAVSHYLNLSLMDNIRKKFKKLEFFYRYRFSIKNVQEQFYMISLKKILVRDEDEHIELWSDSTAFYTYALSVLSDKSKYKELLPNIFNNLNVLLNNNRLSINAITLVS